MRPARSTSSGPAATATCCPSSDAAPAAKADAYLAKFAPAFGASSEQLVRDDVAKNQYGSVVTYVQEYKGIPVFGSLLRVHFDDQGALTGVNGEVVPTAGLSTATRFTAAQAAHPRRQLVRAQPPGEDGRADTTGIKAEGIDARGLPPRPRQG